MLPFVFTLHSNLQMITPVQAGIGSITKNNALIIDHEQDIVVIVTFGNKVFEVQCGILINSIIFKDIVKTIVFRLSQEITPIMRETVQGYFVIDKVCVDFLMLIN